jgi:hypothetical protein
MVVKVQSSYYLLYEPGTAIIFIFLRRIKNWFYRYDQKEVEEEEKLPE